MSPGRPRRQWFAERFGSPVDRLGVALLAFAALAGAGTLSGCGPPTSGRSASDLYTEHCARCHGEDGRGDARALALSPNSNLWRSSFVRRKARGPIYLRISQGYGSMPAFGHKLELGDIELLTDYVLDLPVPQEAR